MRPRSSSQAAPRAAAHCEALLKPCTAPRELAHEFERFGERLAAALRPALSAGQVRLLGTRPFFAGELPELCGPVAANSVHAFGQGDRPLLLSLDARALLAQLDRAFGGSGEVKGELPTELPLSADLLARRLEQQVIAATAAELGGIHFRGGPREANVAALSPFDRNAGLTLMEFEVTPEAGAPWRVLLAVETDALPALLPRRAAARPSAAPRKADANSAPFADVPLTACATLVDMAVPLHRLADLAPGDVLPIMVARNVPLQIGETLIARGTVGEVDKQVALQITQIFSGKDTQ